MRNQTWKIYTLYALAIVLAAILSGHLYAEEQRVNMNTASAEELQALPRVGPAMANVIIQAREDGWKCQGDIAKIEAADDHLLTEIYRIGEATAAKLAAAGAVCDGKTVISETAEDGKAKFGTPKKEGRIPD